MINQIKTYFPENKRMWKEFLWLVLPVIGGSLLFALNSFVDNFMVGHIRGATAGLFAANTWTSIIMGIFMGTSATGSILVAQYYYSGKHEKVREIARIRYFVTIFVAAAFTIAAQVAPRAMIKAFIGSEPQNIGHQGSNWINWDAGVTQGVHYIKTTTIMWMLIALTFNLGNMYREIGYGKIPFIAGILGLTLNVTLNYTTMHTTLFGGEMDAEGAAWASVAARMGTLTIMLFYAIIKKIPIIFNPLKWHKISREIHVAYWKRIAILSMTATTMVFITARNKFYSMGYPEGSQLGAGVGAAAFLGLTGSIFNIFAVTFNAINAIVAKFVGGELGKNNIAKAKENSKRLHGFNTSIAIVMSLALLCLSFVIPYMRFLQNTQAGLAHDNAVLHLTKISMCPLVIFYPWWIWFVTSKSSAVSGGKVNLISLIDSFTAGPLQLGWLAILIFGILPNSPYLLQNFDMTYFLFFLSDIPRGIAFMWVYYKTPWAVNITQDEALAEQLSALDDMQPEGTTMK